MLLGLWLKADEPYFWGGIIRMKLLSIVLAGMAFVVISETAEAQVRVGFDQLDRMEDKIDETLERLDRIERHLRNGGGRGEFYEMTSSVDLQCVNTLFNTFASYNERLEMTNRCRTGDLGKGQRECREVSRTQDYDCYKKLTNTFDNQAQKSEMLEACLSYVFECEREPRRR